MVAFIHNALVASASMLIGSVAEFVALLAIAVLAVWVAGGLLLRLGGIATATTGSLLAAARHPVGLLLAALGVLLWVGGHWHYALRHHTYKSPLARRLFLDVLPTWADPTRNWTTASDDDD
jgi:hypothetical protein